jgi:phosphinothricin acetyltransferase
MSAPEIRAALEADLPAITAIYQQAVREGTATFELEPPDVTEMTRRYRALVDGGYPYFVASTAASQDTPMPAPTGRGRPIALRSRTRSISIRPFTAAASACCCWSG